MTLRFVQYVNLNFISTITSVLFSVLKELLLKTPKIKLALIAAQTVKLANRPSPLAPLVQREKFYRTPNANQTVTLDILLQVKEFVNNV